MRSRVARSPQPLRPQPLAGSLQLQLPEVGSLPLQLTQNPYRIPTCTCRGSPSPLRIVPSKLNSSDVDDGSRKLSRLRTLNTSTSASTWPRPRVRNGCDRRTSQLANALSLRIVLRSRMLPFGQILSAGEVARSPVPWLLAPHFSEVG